MKLLTKFLSTWLAVIALGVVGTGCKEKTQEEKLADAAKDAAQKTEAAVKDAAKKMEGAAKDAAKKMEDATKK